ncbi:nuclear receptor subfamily 5 group A member 2-like [Rhinatrema bivittatum]|uniref:nuclear receptor subfamily 5 group A member 2-like n=1 Tax=Rhinatrema bivittatum TaxID=194408 RepID=UPI00112A76D4|nr:nuclear receptor subfamily 5 group A member 2-like [Rhinatrema bivittatum]
MEAGIEPNAFKPEAACVPAPPSSSSLPEKKGLAPNEESSETCPICSDRVSGYHYGLLTCESCKGFFKRTVQKNKRYICLEEQSCSINKAQRRRCPACRFRKCLSVGMKLEAVRANRMRGGRNTFGPLYRKDRELKRQKKTLVYGGHGGDDDGGGGGRRLGLKQAPTGPSSACSFGDRGAPSPCGRRALSPEPGGEPPAEENPRPCARSATLARCVLRRASRQSPPGGELARLRGRGPLPVGEVPPLLLQMLSCEMEEQQLRGRVLSHLQQEQASRGRHDCLNTFSIICKMVDQTLFCLVQWSRGCVFFKELQVEDQMRLLQNCWTELLMLDHIYRQVLNGKEGSILLVTGQQIDLSVISSQAGDTLTGLVTRTHELVSKFQALRVDQQEMVCLKFLVLFSPDVKNLRDLGFVERVQEMVNRSLMDYTSHQQQQHTDKFGQLLLRLTDIRAISMQAEDYLYLKHLSGDLPCNNLLIEMLHGKQS